MLALRRRNPITYSMCNQTVTVYHHDKTTGTYTKTVYDRAFLDFRKNHNVEKTGVKETNSFLLVIPSSSQTVFPED